MGKKNKVPESDPIDRLIEEPVRRMRGPDALVEAVRAEALEEFPMDLQGVDYSFGDIEIEDGQGGYLPVRDLTEHMSRDRFDSADDLLLGLRDALRKWKGVDIPLDHMKRPEDEAA